MRIALSGSTGLIGSAVAARLGGDHDIVTIGRRPTADIVADFADPSSIAKLDLSSLDALVHCAGVIDEDFAADPARAFRQATLGMAELVRRSKTGGIKRFAYMSTAHVYGPYLGRIDENSPSNPLHDYAIAHFASEQTLRRSADGSFGGAVFRPCAAFGLPPDIAQFRRWSLIPFAFVRDGVRDGRIVLRSSGQQRRNFVGTEDIARCVHNWLEQPTDSHFTVINPVGASSLSVFRFAEICAAIVERVASRACRVERAAPQGADDPFEYSTIDPRWRGEQDLEHTIAALARRIVENRDAPEMATD